MEEIRKLLGRRIKYLRNLRDITQQQLGEKADINYKYLGAIERGEKNPSTDNLGKIAKALGVELHELLYLSMKLMTVEYLRKKLIIC